MLSSLQLVLVSLLGRQWLVFFQYLFPTSGATSPFFFFDQEPFPEFRSVCFLIISLYIYSESCSLPTRSCFNSCPEPLNFQRRWLCYNKFQPFLFFSSFPRSIAIPMATAILVILVLNHSLTWNWMALVHIAKLQLPQSFWLSVFSKWHFAMILITSKSCMEAGRTQVSTPTTRLF